MAAVNNTTMNLGVQIDLGDADFNSFALLKNFNEVLGTVTNNPTSFPLIGAVPLENVPSSAFLWGILKDCFLASFH